MAIPFNAGRRPYEQIAFQFSHHVMHADGRVVNETQYLDLTVGKFPNYDFVRAPKTALSKNEGSVFRWANHEQTILRAIYEQLKSDPRRPADANELCAFIESLTYTVNARGDRVPSPRSMIDLADIAARYYFHVGTIRTAATTVINSGTRIDKRARIISEGLGKQLKTLQHKLARSRKRQVKPCQSDAVASSSAALVGPRTDEARQRNRLFWQDSGTTSALMQIEAFAC